MDKELRVYIEYLLCIKITDIHSISGGDISQAYLLETDTERFFCKINRSETAYRMFLSEKEGLEAILKTKTINVPKVLICEALEKGGFLLMEYIEPKRPSTKDMERFGHQLAALHQITASDIFGWETDNFIGSLPQSNAKHQNWTDFYVKEHLCPQLKLARNGNRLQRSQIPSEERLLQVCRNLLPEVKPSLLHGDLWSGNYLIAENGTPYLIDPAVYFGHHEVDIAMTRLFGGFNAMFYRAYSEHFPEIGSEKERTELYQLYYLLVHLNLFGTSYSTSVLDVLKKYF